MPYKFEDYEMVIFPNEKKDAFVATFFEMPTLSGIGATHEEAKNELREAFEIAMEINLERNEPMPVPFSARDYSGQFRVRVPKDLHKELVIYAENQNTSLNQLIVYLLAKGVSNGFRSNFTPSA